MRKSVSATLGAVAAVALAAGVAGTSVGIANAAPEHSSVKVAASKVPAPVVSVPELKGGMTGVKLDSGFASALQTLGLTPSMVGTGKLEDGSVLFPITGGSVTYWSPKGEYRPYVQGIVLHEGSGLRLTAANGTYIDLTNFTINPGVSRLYGDVSVNGQPVVQQAHLFRLFGSTLKPLSTEGNNAILTGTTVHLSQTAADTLNKVFATDAVKKDLLVGTATITAQVQ